MGKQVFKKEHTELEKVVQENINQTLFNMDMQIFSRRVLLEDMVDNILDEIGVTNKTMTELAFKQGFQSGLEVGSGLVGESEKQVNSSEWETGE